MSRKSYWFWSLLLPELMADECPYRESKAMSFVLVFWYLHNEVISSYFLI